MIISWLDMGVHVGAYARENLLSRWAAYDEPEGESKDLRIRLNVYPDHADAWWFPKDRDPNDPNTGPFIRLTAKKGDAEEAKQLAITWVRREFGVDIVQRKEPEIRPIRVHPKTREVMQEIGMISADPSFGGVVWADELKSWEWHQVGGNKDIRHGVRSTPDGRAQMHVTITPRGDDFGYQGRIELDAWERRWVHTVNSLKAEDIDALAEDWADSIVAKNPNEPIEMDPISTTDAVYWAETFTKRFGGKYITAYTADPEEGEVDFGTMVAWFANAIETGRKAGHVQIDPEEKLVELLQRKVAGLEEMLDQERKNNKALQQHLVTKSEAVPDEDALPKVPLVPADDVEASFIADLDRLVDGMRERIRVLQQWRTNLLNGSDQYEIQRNEIQRREAALDDQIEQAYLRGKEFAVTQIKSGLADIWFGADPPLREEQDHDDDR